MSLLRLALAGIFLMTMLTAIGCQPTTLERTRQMSMRPGALVDPVFKDDAAEISEDTGAEEIAASREDMRNRRLLSDMEVRDRDFNRRLSGVLGQGAEPRLAGRGISAGRAVRGETVPVSFNFFDADLAEVVRLFMELLKENYSLDSKVGGKVALHVDTDMSRDEIWELFRGVLRIHSAAAVLDNGIWRIVPLAEVSTAVDAGDIVFDEDGVRKRG